MIRAGTILAILALASPVAAQKPGCALQLDSRSLEPGEAVDFQLVCTNTGDPSVPKANVSEGLDLRLLNRTPFVSSHSSWINGRTSQKVSYTYKFRLSAVQEGTHVLGPITVLADGTTYKTDPVSIVVRERETTSVPRADRYVYAEIEVRPTSLYVTETVRATLTIGIRKVVINGQMIDMNLLGLIGAGSSFSVFEGGKARSSTTTLRDSAGRAHRYEVFRVTKDIRAEEIGEKLIGPVFLKVGYPTAVRRGFFSRGYETSRSRKETARAEAVRIEVKGAPEEGRPPSFTGAIGRFKMNVTAKPTHVELGAPVTLTIAITGSPVEGVAGPDITGHPQLVSRFDFTKDELLGDLERGAKVFRRAIFPKQEGEQTIPPIAWSYFDLQRKDYVTLTNDPIGLSVDPSSTASPAISLLAETPPEDNGTTLTVLTGGISPNYVDAGAVLADHGFVLSPPWVSALVLPPVAYLFVILTTRHRARLRADAGFARRRRAQRHARASIGRTLANGDPGVALEGLSAALTGYLSDRFNLPPGELTPGDAGLLLTENGLAETSAGEVAAFLEKCATARYAPSLVGESSARDNAARVRKWIKQIERATR